MGSFLFEKVKTLVRSHKPRTMTPWKLFEKSTEGYTLGLSETFCNGHCYSVRCQQETYVTHRSHHLYFVYILDSPSKIILPSNGFTTVA